MNFGKPPVGGPGAGRALGALCGVPAVAAALGAAELTAAPLRPQAGPLVAVGSAFIDLAPRRLKDAAIRAFGADDKLVLLIGIVATVLAIAAVAGLAARRRPRLAPALPAALGLTAAAAALSRPGAAPTDALPSLVAAVVGALALRLLLGSLSRRAVRPSQLPPVPEIGTTAPGQEAFAPSTPGLLEGGLSDRRALLRTGTATLAFAALTGGSGRAITAARDSAARGTGLVLPRPAESAPPLPPGSDLRIPGLSPFTTPDDGFYRVDTALVIPRVPLRDWRLRVHGLVDRPVELTFEELLRRPLIERDITLTCVSNEVGGPYAGTARWLGIDLAALLREAGVSAGADQIMSRSADGWTCGTPVETVLDGRAALLAVGMNGRALPPAHGFPARLIVPGLYGYVSATKWVTEIKLTRFAGERAYWAERGWAQRAPVKTASRIEVPKPFARLRAGPAVIAGVAWAPHRGVAAVEVRVDGGPWRQARLAPSPGPDTWRQWHMTWDATPGDHRLEVRATDTAGLTQTADRVPPFPSGATGRHSVLVTVL
ncbi:molybdopterin-dependent oxidoreductase [Planotetraspora sp. A-T 1434]|uniref:molybdopterin-dependent oxidoreductase n=1 Tax=Planotetraspora sp. A-T 1434 TaxID=2979219 RepID=UPI0021C13265|nr:molybdopterin-dependent oxidoreductase [Planotetraspora sp. A-T 1434]MCT9934621.1 molybdopterin-dependent oxidoreductase [Planotetraspora sp. A-T 1434]